MKTFIAALLLGIGISAASCNNSETGSSTPVDSTVQNGTAPVDYQSGAGGMTADTTMQHRDDLTSDTMGQSRMQTPTAPATGNTTDPRTTSGSAPGNTQR